MALDASIPLAALGRGPTIDPFQVAQSLSTMQNMRANTEALNAQRDASTALKQSELDKQQRDLAESNALKQLFSGNQPVHPEQVYAVVGPQRGAEILKGLSALHEQDIKTDGQMRSVLGSVIGGIKALPPSLQEQTYNDVVAQFSKRGMIDPAQVKPFSPQVLDMYQQWAMTPEQQTTNARAEATQAAVLPGQQADARAKQRQDAASVLSAATDAAQYASSYTALDPAVAKMFPPPASFNPKVTPSIVQRIGMTPDQQAGNQVAQGQLAVSQGNLAVARGNAAETARHNQVAESFQDPSNPKRQDALEQQYRNVLTRTLSSRSGGMGMEDQKVNQAIHLISLMDQNRDPKTGAYTIPKAQYAELANGLATLISPNGRPTDSMRNEIETRTASGDLAGLVTYLTGKPVTGSTQEIFKMLRDSIERQGQVAEQNREGYFNSIRAMAPTELADDRRQKLEQSLKLNSIGKPADGDVIYAKDTHGNIHSAKKGTPLPAGWQQVSGPGA